MKKKISAAVLVTAIVLVLGLATAVAAGVIGWQRGLEDRLQVTEDVKAAYQDTDLFEHPGLTVSHSGIDLTLEECIVEPSAAYLAFRVKGWQPELQPGTRPWFRDVTVDVEGLEDRYCYVEPLFFDGLDGWGMTADGTGSEDGVPTYVNEDGDMVFILHLRCDAEDFSFVGKELRARMAGLSVVADGDGRTLAEAEGEWAFNWTMKGTGLHRTLADLSLPLGDTGAVLTGAELSPLYVRLTMTAPRPAASVEGVPDAPWFRGLRLKDGTVLDMLAGRGWADWAEETGEDYRQMWSLHRIIDPAQVAALRFDMGEGTEVTEVTLPE